MARLTFRRLLLVGVAVGAAAAYAKREQVRQLLPGGASSTPEPYSPPAPAPSNYDAPGPPANTSTPVPAPEPVVRGETGAIDEAAEEAAAAAEAANIGGQVSDYADIQEPDRSADEADRPLVEAGEGSAEGQEQAEAALADAAATDAEGASDYERQIEDAIDEAGQPFAGERTDPIVSEPEPEALAPQPVEPPAAETPPAPAA